jgi:N-ATPase, AtpR subunit
MTGVSFVFVASFAGLVVGLVHFAALRRTVDLYSAGRGRLAEAALTLGRIAGTIVFFCLVAKLGALPLLSSFLGFLLARTFALCAVRRTT